MCLSLSGFKGLTLFSFLSSSARSQNELTLLEKIGMTVMLKMIFLPALLEGKSRSKEIQMTRLPACETE